MYIVQRRYGRQIDYLHGWDRQYGTICKGTPDGALSFHSVDEANDAAEEANRICYSRPADMMFRAVPNPRAAYRVEPALWSAAPAWANYAWADGIGTTWFENKPELVHDELLADGRMQTDHGVRVRPAAGLLKRPRSGDCDLCGRWDGALQVGQCQGCINRYGTGTE